MSLTPEQAAQLKTTLGRNATNSAGNPGESKIWSGGTFSDIMDAVQIPQYALTGLFSGKGVGYGVENRLTPSKELNLKGVGGFVADVLLDPLTYVGIGGLTKTGKVAKAAGKAKSTFAASVKAGERSLLSLDVPFVKSLQGQTLLKGENVAKGFTKTGEAIKRTPILGGALEKMGVRKAAGTFDVNKIEDILSSTGKYADEASIAGARQVAAKATFVTKLQPILQKGYKAGLDEKSFKNIGAYASGFKGAKLAPKELVFYNKELKPIVEELVDQYTKTTGIKLEGKTLTNVMTKEALDKNRELAEFMTSTSALGKKQGIEGFSSYSKIGGKLHAGSETKLREVFGKGQMVKLGKKGYVEKRVLEKIKTLEEHLANLQRLKKKGMADDLSNRTLTAVRKDLSKLRNSAKPRTAVSNRELNEMLVKMGRDPMFDENIFNILSKQGSQLGVLKARKAMVETLMNKKVFPEMKTIEKGGAIPQGYSKIRIKGLEDYILPNDMAKPLNKVQDKFSNIDSVNDFFRNYDKLQNFWKKTATYLNPAFHARNFVSNNWQLHLADAFDPVAIARDYKQMRKLNKAVNKGATKFDDILKGKERGWWDDFRRDGVGGTGRFTADIEEQQLKKSGLLNKPFQVAGEFGGQIEDSAKWTLYKKRRAAGFTPKTAREEVAKYLFDYNDLTDFERNIMKRAFPFYTWSRKNIPLQVGMLIQKPGKFSAVDKAKHALESMQEGEPMDERLLPEWMSQGYNVWLGENPEGMQNFLKLEGFLPAVDLGMIGRPLDEGIESFTPMIKSPMEILLNYDSFYKKQIEEYPGQTKPIAGIQVPAKLEKLARQIRPISEYEKLFGLSSASTQKDLTKMEQLGQFLFGRNIRSFDEENEQYWSKRDYDTMENKMKSELKKAKKNDDVGKENSILKALAKLKDNRIK